MVSVHLPLVALPERAAQLALEDLARAAERQRLVAELDATPHLPMGECAGGLWSLGLSPPAAPYLNVKLTR
jgi:hypothetical protein